MSVRDISKDRNVIQSDAERISQVLAFNSKQMYKRKEEEEK